MKLAKLLLYIIIAFIVLFLYWFLPKYSFIQKNPGYCVNLTEHIYYCGNHASLDSLFNIKK